ncbi:hypothetical protein [Marispirochaeta sp.]|jgi:hypothetical protein|uniref:hypothetical protein n=1 Tax=Marispirochaeta sp. TaxID=2038653 RepID=UPI0029C70104|nr:hypothetical protein [Marispirochaeta sp.]
MKTAHKRFELIFSGAFRMITKKRSAIVDVPFYGDGGDYERLYRTVSEYVSDRIPYIILREGQNLEELLKSGEELQDNDVLTIVPLILGG